MEDIINDLSIIYYNVSITTPPFLFLSRTAVKSRNSHRSYFRLVGDRDFAPNYSTLHPDTHNEHNTHTGNIPCKCVVCSLFILAGLRICVYVYRALVCTFQRAHIIWCTRWITRTYTDNGGCVVQLIVAKSRIRNLSSQPMLRKSRIIKATSKTRVRRRSGIMY